MYNLIAEIKPNDSGAVTLVGDNPELLVKSPGVLCNVDGDMVFEKRTDCYIELSGELLKNKKNFAIEMHLKNAINSSHSFNTLFACENLLDGKSENEFGILYFNNGEIKLSSWNAIKEHGTVTTNTDILIGNWNHVKDDYHTIKIEVCNKVLKFYINDVLSYSGAYDNSMQTDNIFIGQEPDKRSTPGTPNFDATQALYAFIKWMKIYDITPPSEDLVGIELGYYENSLTSLDGLELINTDEASLTPSNNGLQISSTKHMITKLSDVPKVKDFIAEFTIVGGSHSSGSIGLVMQSKQLEPISDTFGIFAYIGQDNTYNNYVSYGKGSNVSEKPAWHNYGQQVTLNYDKSIDKKIRIMFVNSKVTMYVNDNLIYSEIYLKDYANVELYDLAFRAWDCSVKIKDLKIYSPEILSEIKKTYSIEHEEIKANDDRIILKGSAIKGYRNEISLTSGTAHTRGCLIVPNFFKESRDVEVTVPLIFDSPNSNEGGDAVTIQLFTDGEYAKLIENRFSPHGIALQHIHWKGNAKGQSAIFVEHKDKKIIKEITIPAFINDKPRCVNMLTVKYINQELIYILNDKEINKVKFEFDSNSAKEKDLIIRADCGGVYQKVFLNGLTYKVISKIYKERFLLESPSGLKKPVLESSETISVSNVPIRYIRDYLAGNSKESNSHWYEIQAINSDGINMARHKEVKAFTTGTYKESELLRVTDEDTSTSHFGIISNNTECYVQVDLGHAYKLSMVKVWHYHNDKRVYNNTKTEVSHNGEDWIVLFDSAISGTYAEDASGKTHNLAGINITKENYILEDVVGDKDEATILEHGLTLDEFNKSLNSCKELDSSYKVIAYSDNDDLNKSLRIKGLPNDTVVKHKYDIDYSMEYVKGIESIKATFTINNNSDAKVAFSFDSGSTWKSFSGDTFIDVNIEDVSEFNNDAMNITNFNSLNATQLGMIYEPRKLRLAFCVSKDNYLDIFSINKIEIKYIVEEI